MAIAILSIATGAVCAEELDLSRGYVARAAKTGQLLDESNRPTNVLESLKYLLDAEVSMPPDYWRAHELRRRIIDVEQSLSNKTDMSNVNARMREHYRADAFRRLQVLAEDKAMDQSCRAQDLVNLASRELQLGRIDDADKHCREAVVNGWKPNLLRPTPSSIDTTVAALIKARRFKKAESLLLFVEAQYERWAKLENIDEHKNYFLAEQKAKRFAFLAEAGRSHDADIVLDEILRAKDTFSENEICQYFLINQLNKTFDNLSKSNTPKSGGKDLFWAKRLLAWELDRYEGDDFRIGETKLSLGTLLERDDHLPEAIANYSDALAIAIKYGAEAEQDRYWRPLRSLERISQKLRAEPHVNNKTLSEIDKTLSQAKTDVAYITVLSPYEYAGQLDPGARFVALKRLAPYSAASGACFYGVYQLYVKLKRWDSIPPLVAAVVEYHRHKSPIVIGGIFSGDSFFNSDRNWILFGVEAILKTSGSTAAAEFLQQQMPTSKAVASTSILVCYAQAAAPIGDSALSLRLWKAALDARAIGDVGILEREVLPALQLLKADSEVAQAKEFIVRVRGVEAERRDAEHLVNEAKFCKEIFAPSVSKQPYGFTYAALASKALKIAPEARINCNEPPSLFWSYAFAGSFGSMNAPGLILQSGGLKFLYRGDLETLGPPSRLVTHNDFKPELVGSRFFYGPPAVPRRPFEPPPDIPADAKLLGDISAVQTLPPGDYKAPGGEVTNLDMLEKGKVRLFLTDASDGANGLTVRAGGWINISRADRPCDDQGDFCAPYQFEIWYGGKRPVRFEKNATYSGTIYAPYADVVLEDGAQIRGAVIARTITLNGKAQIFFVRR